MYLLKLDEDDVVIECAAIATSPSVLTHLNSNYMLSHHEVSVGSSFNSDSRAFSPPPAPRHITRLAFLQRFTMEENVGIEVASESNADMPMEQRVRSATLRKMQQLVNAANWIDLDRPDTRGMVMQIEQMGLLRAGRALEILDNVVTEAERPQADMPKAVEA